MKKKDFEESPDFQDVYFKSPSTRVECTHRGSGQLAHILIAIYFKFEKKKKIRFNCFVICPKEKTFYSVLKEMCL